MDTTSFLGYENYRLALHEHTLEGVLTLNRLRESTGILLYGFGGVGLTNYSVKANYENGIFGDYNYSSIDNSQSPNEIVDDLDRILDNSYETTIKERGTDFMPSLGFGIGYQFPYHFSMGIEHKITYALADNKLNEASIKLHHILKKDKKTITKLFEIYPQAKDIQEIVDIIAQYKD